jgi:dipeptidyl aminopeptidase/acylaminoacyl peptidase
MLRTLIIALALTLAPIASATVDTPATVEPGFLSDTDCFAATPDYESWLATLPRAADAVSASELAAMVSAKTFDFARAAFDCRRVTYASGGHTVSGYVVRPRSYGTATRALPLLVYNRGGNGEFGKVEGLQLFQTLLPFAKAGYMVVASQYREADEFGGRDVDDVMRLIDLALALPDTDARRIFLLGQSRGAMMSYLIARRRSDITAMATIAGPVDLAAGLKWRAEMEHVYRARIPGYGEDPHAALTLRSALHWAEHLPADVPVLLLHGDADDRVHVDESRAMSARLQHLGHPHKLIVYPGDNHGLQRNRRAARAEILAWFEQAAAPPLQPD